MSTPSIGVLALQGGFDAHLKCFDAIGIQAHAVRTCEQAQGCSGLVIPGGESTVLMRLLAYSGLDRYIQQQHQQGLALWGTCAGAIVLASHVFAPQTPSLKCMDVNIRRNAYGRQVSSALKSIHIAETQHVVGEGVFIRAPEFESWGHKVHPLLTDSTETTVALSQGRCLSLTFHPECSNTLDLDLHAWFAQVAFNSSQTFSLSTLKDLT